MTRVVVVVEEIQENGAENVVLHIPVREFRQGAQFGETSEAITWAQRLVKRAEKLT